MSTLDITLYSSFMAGKYEPGAIKMANGFRKMAARLRKPQTARIKINAEVEYELRVIKHHRVLEPLPETELVRMMDMMPCLPMSHVTLHKMLKADLFPPCFKQEGRFRYWKTKEVQDWIDQQDHLNLVKH